MSLPAVHYEERFTYADYLIWPDDERWELIDGVAYDMSPAPSTNHQRVSRQLLVQFANFLEQNACEVFQAPFDVRLPESDEADDEIENVVQPDISVICDPSKLDSKGCKGAPDLIIEILSPSTAKKDRHEKFLLYERHGVKEYWIVHQSEHLVEVFKLNDDGVYDKPDIYAGDDVVPVGLFPGLDVNLGIVFGIPKTDTHADNPGKSSV
jgi:Uma2 family endonuclease